MTTLWELSAEWQRLMQQLEETGGELTEELETSIDKLAPVWEVKVESCCHVMDELEARQETLKAHVDRLTTAMRKLKRARESLRDYVRWQFVATGKRKTVTSTHIVTLQDNSVPSVVISDWDAIPTKYRKVKESPDTSAIKDSLTNGETVDGARLEYGQHLRTRVGAAGKGK